MNITKTEMAQTIVKILFNLDSKPKASDNRVIETAKVSKRDLMAPYERALKMMVESGEIVQNTMDWNLIFADPNIKIVKSHN